MYFKTFGVRSYLIQLPSNSQMTIYTPFPLLFEWLDWRMLITCSVKTYHYSKNEMLLDNT